MTAPRRIWVTRTQPEADITAERLAAIGLIPVVASVLAARPLAGIAIDLTGVDALAFTSRHAIAAFARLSPERGVPTYTVGSASAVLARDLGFSAIIDAAGDARDLTALIARAAPRPARVLNPTAREAAADLPALLAGHGVTAMAVAVYETVETDAAPPLADIDAVLVHSPKAGRIVGALLAGRPEVARIDAYAISPAAAEPLREVGLRRVASADRPSDAALLWLLTR